MKRGFSATMLKQKSSRRSGWENPRHDKKRSTSVSLKCEGDVDSFFDWKSIVHHEFVPRGETVNKEFYLKVTRRLREAVRRKRPEAWINKTCMLHHYNAPPHASLLIREFLAKQEPIVVPQPPTLQIWPCGLFPVPKVEVHTKRSPISDGRGDKRKFATGPSRHPAKHVPGRVPELEKTLGAVYQQ